MNRAAARLAPSQAQKTQRWEGPYRLEWLLAVPQKRYADQIEGLDSLRQIQHRPLPVAIRSDTLRATKRPRKVDNEELEQLHGEKASRLPGKIMSQLETKESEDQSIIEKELDQICQDEQSLKLLIFGIMQLADAKSSSTGPFSGHETLRTRIDGLFWEGLYLCKELRDGIRLQGQAYSMLVIPPKANKLFFEVREALRTANAQLSKTGGGTESNRKSHHFKAGSVSRTD
jgi:hypothetical protein